MTHELTAAIRGGTVEHHAHSPTDSENIRMIAKQLRIPESALEEAKALMPFLDRDRAMIARGRITLSDVLRMAVMEGLEVLKVRYATAEQERP
jgi:hypothetical protein